MQWELICNWLDTPRYITMLCSVVDTKGFVISLFSAPTERDVWEKCSMWNVLSEPVFCASSRFSVFATRIFVTGFCLFGWSRYMAKSMRLFYFRTGCLLFIFMSRWDCWMFLRRLQLPVMDLRNFKTRWKSFVDSAVSCSLTISLWTSGSAVWKYCAKLQVIMKALFSSRCDYTYPHSNYCSISAMTHTFITETYPGSKSSCLMWSAVCCIFCYLW